MKKPTHSIGIVVVAYGNPTATKRLIELLAPQLKKPDRIVVVDNHIDHKCADMAEAHPAVSAVIRSDNVGFSGGCNKGASVLPKTIDTYMFMNYDIIPSPNLLQSARAVDRSVYSAWMPLILLPDGKVNSAGNVVHTSGLSWCGGYLDSKDDYTDTKEIAVLSGACFSITKSAWDKVGGMPEGYFMYYEDTDLSGQLQLRGAKIALTPDASVVHDYDFKKGGHKWLYIERNRPLYIIRVWPLAVIIMTAPLLLAVGVGLWGVAIIDGRFASKLRSLGMTVAGMPEALMIRHHYQRNKTVTSSGFFMSLSPELDSPLLGAVGRNRAVQSVFSLHYRATAWVLHRFSRV